MSEGLGLGWGILEKIHYCVANSICNAYMEQNSFEYNNTLYI